MSRPIAEAVEQFTALVKDFRADLEAFIQRAKTISSEAHLISAQIVAANPTLEAKIKPVLDEMDGHLARLTGEMQ